MNPAQLTDVLLSASEAVLARPLNDQQRIFVQHIHASARSLQHQISDLPAGTIALRQILPVLAESLEKPLTALVGYARMLIEHPASFGDATLDPHQQQAMQHIFDAGMAFGQLIEQVRRDAFAERVAAHKAPPVAFDLAALLHEHAPIYRYWLSNRAVTLEISSSTPLATVYASPYHSAALFAHLTRTIGHELLEYGKITLHIHSTPASVEVLLTSTGIRFSAEEWQILFAQDSRHLYLERMQAQHIHHEISRQSGIGATLHLHFPLAPATASFSDSA